MTNRAPIVVEVFLSCKHRSAPRGRTPVRLLAHLHEVVEGKLLEFLPQNAICEVVDIRHAESLSAALHWAVDVHFV